MNDFESENFFVVNFINRQTLYCSIGMINKIIWWKYYTDSCSATIIILSSVATPKNCTIMRQQRYFKTVCRISISSLVQNSVSFVSDNCLQSVSHRTVEILQSGQRKWSTRFPEMMFEWRQCLWLWAGINSCSHNAPNVFNRRQIWRIWRPISRWNVMSDICHCE